jgi:hypothetical protein
MVTRLFGLIILLFVATIPTRAVAQTESPLPVRRMVDIGDSESVSDYVFEYPTAGLRLSNGMLAVADGPAAIVSLFDESGRLMHTVGGHGRGPGEFQRVDWIGQCQKNSVFAWDARQQRMTVIDHDGSVARVFRFPELPAIGGPATAVTCAGNGQFAYLGTPSNLASPKRGLGWVHFEATLSIADLQGAATVIKDDVLAFEARPLGKVTALAVSANRVYVGTKDSASIDVFAIGGDGHTVLGVPIELRKPTSRHFERAIDAQAAVFRNVATREETKQLLFLEGMPENLPAYGTVLLDDEETLWVQTSIPGDPITTIVALDDDGEVIARLELPIDSRVFDIGLDHVLVAYEHESGEPHVAMYGFDWAR